MRVRFLGSGDAFGSGGRLQTWAALADAARGADLFICEAYHFEKRVPFHLDYRTLLAHRAELACKRLVLTHMSADLLARASELSLETASDGYEIEL